MTRLPYRAEETSMDTLNHFFTPATVLHARIEYGLGFVACTLLMLFHWHELDVLWAIVLFAYMDSFWHHSRHVGI